MAGLAGVGCATGGGACCARAAGAISVSSTRTIIVNPKHCAQCFETSSVADGVFALMVVCPWRDTLAREDRRLIAVRGRETILGWVSLQYRAKKRRLAVRYESWTTTSNGGKIVRFAYKELSDGVAGISAKTDGRFVMIVQRSIRAPLTRKQVEAVFERASLD